jgi:hypothetical protein
VRIILQVFGFGPPFSSCSESVHEPITLSEGAVVNVWSDCLADRASYNSYCPGSLSLYHRASDPPRACLHFRRTLGPYGAGASGLHSYMHSIVCNHSLSACYHSLQLASIIGSTSGHPEQGLIVSRMAQDNAACTVSATATSLQRLLGDRCGRSNGVASGRIPGTLRVPLGPTARPTHLLSEAVRARGKA